MWSKTSDDILPSIERLLFVDFELATPACMSAGAAIASDLCDQATDRLKHGGSRLALAEVSGATCSFGAGSVLGIVVRRDVDHWRRRSVGPGDSLRQLD